MSEAMTTPGVASSAVTGRYAIFDEIAAGGMATVHLGRLAGPVSFSRTVAVKRLHPHLALRPDSVRLFLEEARLTAHVRHTNVVSTIDIVSSRGETFLVMEYVHGDTVARLLEVARALPEPMPVPVACAIAVGMLHGLNAAHEAVGERGERLEIVHCDVSPQNVMVGTDGVARVIDFGVAQVAGRLPAKREGQLKGKLGYTAPEVVRGRGATRAADVYSAAVVLWEMLTGGRLFAGENDGNVLERVLFADVAGPSRAAAHVPAALDAIVLRGLARDPALRFATAREMARAIEGVVPIADASEVGEWVEQLAGSVLAERSLRVARIEAGASALAEVGAPDGAGLVRADASGNLPVFEAGRGPEGAQAAGPEWNVRSLVRVSPVAPRPWYRRSRSALLAVIGAASVAAVATLAQGRWRDRAAEAHAATPEPQAGVAPEPQAPPAPAATPEAAPVAAPAAVAAGPGGETSPPAPAAVHPPRRGPGRSTPVRPAPAPHEAATEPAAPKDAVRCNPPWTLDASGIRKYRLECL